MTTLSTKLKQEILTAIPIVIYFVIVFNLIHFVTDLAIKPGNRPYYSTMTVTIWALVAAKVLLIVDVMPFFDLFVRKPLIYNIIWKFSLYSIASVLFRIFDILLHERLHYGNFDAAIHVLNEQLVHPLFWSIQLFIMMTLCALVVFREIARALGKQQMRTLLFG